MHLKFINTGRYSTLRQVLIKEFELSSRLITKLKKNNLILLNGKTNYLDKKINIGDIITVNLDFEEEQTNIIPSKMNLEILHEDDCFLIVDKPAGIPVHPSMRHYKDSLSSGVKFYFDFIGLKKKIRIVNRLDKNTSGIVIFAKNEYIQETLAKQMEKGLFKKTYIAFCEGHFEKNSETIIKPIARKENSIIERCVDLKNGQESITKYKVIKENNNISKVEVNILTGRTHQIRVHMSYIGHPIIGDDLYGSKSSLISRQALHAYKVKFIHPILKKEIIIKSSLPKDFKNLEKNI